MARYSFENAHIPESNNAINAINAINSINAINAIIDAKTIYTRKSNMRSVANHSIETPLNNLNLMKSFYQRNKNNPRPKLSNKSPHHHNHKICPIYINSYMKTNLTLNEDCLFKFKFNQSQNLNQFSSENEKQNFVNCMNCTNVLILNHTRNESIMNKRNYLTKKFINNDYSNKNKNKNKNENKNENKNMDDHDSNLNRTEWDGAVSSQSKDIRNLTSQDVTRIIKDYRHNTDSIKQRNKKLPEKFNTTIPDDDKGNTENQKNPKNCKNVKNPKNLGNPKNHLYDENYEKLQRNECILFTNDAKRKRKKSLSICEYKSKKSKLSHSNSPSSKINDSNIVPNPNQNQNPAKKVQNFFIEARQIIQNPRKESMHSPKLVRIRKSLTDKKQNIETKTTNSATKDSQNILNKISPEGEHASNNNNNLNLSSCRECNIEHNSLYLDPITKIFIKRKKANHNKPKPKQKISESSCIVHQNSKILKSFHLYNQDVIFLKSYK